MPPVHFGSLPNVRALLPVPPQWASSPFTPLMPADKALEYLLRHDFLLDHAAGALIGVAAEPGPGAVAGLDTNGIMTSSGGRGVISGTPAANDRFHLGTVSRVAGQVFKITFPTLTTIQDNSARFGFTSNTTTANEGLPGLAHASTTTVRIRDSTTSIYTFTIGAAPHTFALVTRATGGWSFALVAGHFVMLYIHPTNNAATLTPKLIMTTAAAHSLTFANFRAPVDLFIPTPMAYDTFTRANGALGSSETVGPDAQTVTARAWTDQVGTWAVASNAAAATATSGGIAIATVPTSSADVHVRARLTRPSAGNVGCVARYQDANNYLFIHHDGTNMVCTQVVAGTPTVLRTGAATYSAGAIGHLIVSGTTGWLFYNNAAVGASFTVPASTQTAHGLYTTDTGNSMDIFEAWPYGTGGEYDELATF